MAKVTYIGNGNSKKVSKIYLGSGNTSHKIKKGYIGDSSGKARLFFSSGYQWQRYSLVTEYVWNRYNLDISYKYTYDEQKHNGDGSRVVDGDDYVYLSHLDQKSGQYEASSEMRADQAKDDWLPCAICFTDPATTMYDCYNWEDAGGSGYRLRFKYDQYWTITKEIDRTYYNQGSYIDQVTSTSSNTYPNDNYKGNYWYVYSTSRKVKGSLIDTVENDNENAYPTNGISGNYWYVKIT